MVNNILKPSFVFLNSLGVLISSISFEKEMESFPHIWFKYMFSKDLLKKHKKLISSWQSFEKYCEDILMIIKENKEK